MQNTDIAIIIPEPTISVDMSMTRLVASLTWNGIKVAYLKLHLRIANPVQSTIREASQLGQLKTIIIDFI